MSRSYQPSLFDEPEPSGLTAPGPAAVPDRLRRVAAGLSSNIRLGTSSWSFPGWSGLVYDRAATQKVLSRYGLSAYARHPLLRTVGIDRTFYAPLPAESFAGYAAAVPDDFRFLVKASSRCTSPRLRDAAGVARNDLFLSTSYASDEVIGPFVEGLAQKAGPLVFQFPPLGRELTADPLRFADTLGEFLSRLPTGPLYAVEVRDRTLLCKEYFSNLDAVGARHCHGLHPRLPSLAKQYRSSGAMAGGPLIVRWMLHGRLGYEEAVQRYQPFSQLVDEDASTRESLAGICLEEISRDHEVLVVANNKAEGSAPLSVFNLASSIAGLQA